MQLLWWHWAVLGIALVLAELAIPSFYIVWFGLGAILVSLLVWLFPAASLTTQLLLWTLASLAMVFLWFRIFRRDAHRTRIGMSDPHILGEIGLLVRDVAPFQKGQVRFQKPLIGSEVWECIADEAISAGERVRILSVEGSFLKIGKVPDAVD